LDEISIVGDGKQTAGL